MTMSNRLIIASLESIERESRELRKLLQDEPPAEAAPSLYGIWKGLDVTDEDIEEAKRSLFGAARWRRRSTCET